MPTVSSVTKHFASAKEGFTTTLASTISSAAATVPLNSISGYTNGDTVVMVVDPSDATKKQAFTGVVDTSGVQLTSVVWTEGTNQTHTTGATVVDYETATHWAMYAKGLLRDHNQSGYHKTLNDDNANEWIKQTSTASAVNEITVANNATTLPPVVSATGGDTNIDLRISGKGSGKAYVDGFAEIAFDFVVSGAVWTADSAGSNRNGSMTAGVFYINGQRGSIAAVSAHTFTASKDTYIDILNTAGVFTVVYTEVNNNAASPALAANSLRIGIVVTAAGSIAAAGSINQGQEDRVLPIASSTPYQICDSLGNVICNRNPAKELLGGRIITTGGQSGISTVTDITGMSVTVKTDGLRKVVVESQQLTSATATADEIRMSIKEGATTLAIDQDSTTNGKALLLKPSVILTPTAGSHTYKLTLERTSGAGTMSTLLDVTFPAFITVKMV